MFLLFLLLNFAPSEALEVIKPQYETIISLKIIRAEPDSFETYALTNHNGREMVLICAKNRVYDENKKAMIEYRNYYNVIVGYFTLENNQACKDMGRFIEASSAGISEEKPFVINLNTKTMKVDTIRYPQINIFVDEGKIEDLLPKRMVREKSEIELPEVRHD